MKEAKSLELEEFHSCTVKCKAYDLQVLIRCPFNICLTKFMDLGQNRLLVIRELERAEKVRRQGHGD